MQLEPAACTGPRSSCFGGFGADLKALRKGSYVNSQHMKIWVKGEGVVLSWEGSGEPAPYFLAGVSVSPAIKSGFVNGSGLKW